MTVLDGFFPRKLADGQVYNDVESLLVDQIENLRDSDHPNHLKADTINVVKHVKRKSGQQV
jgi:hypothetical protein